MFPFLKEVMFCDDSCRGDRFDSVKFHESMDTIEKIGRDFKEFHKNKSVKLVDGRVVMELTGLKPSPVVGGIIKEVSERFMNTTKFVCMKRLILEVADEMK